MNRDEKRQVKLQQVKEYRASGLSLKKWCSQSGEKFSTMKYWCKVERENRTKPQTHSAAKRKDHSSWIQLAPMDENDTKSVEEEKVIKTQPFKITVNDIHLEIPQGFDAHELKMLIGVMRSC